MNTYLGASALFGPDDVDVDMVAAARVVYLEGYLWDRPEAKEAYRKAARIAHEAGNEVSLTLSDSFCVDRHRPEWLQLVEEEVDILFANEAEICSLYESDFETGEGSGTSATVASPRSTRSAARLGDRRRPARRTWCRPTRSTGWSTPPARAISTRRVPSRLHERRRSRDVRPARVAGGVGGDHPPRRAAGGEPVGTGRAA